MHFDRAVFIVDQEVVTKCIRLENIWNRYLQLKTSTRNRKWDIHRREKVPERSANSTKTEIDFSQITIIMIPV